VSDTRNNVIGRIERIEEDVRETRDLTVEMRAAMLGINGEGGFLQHQADTNKLLTAATKRNARGVQQNRRSIAWMRGIGTGAVAIGGAAIAVLGYLLRM